MLIINYQLSSTTQNKLQLTVQSLPEKLNSRSFDCRLMFFRLNCRLLDFFVRSAVFVVDAKAFDVPCNFKNNSPDLVNIYFFPLIFRLKASFGFIGFG